MPARKKATRLFATIIIINLYKIEDRSENAVTSVVNDENNYVQHETIWCRLMNYRLLRSASSRRPTEYTVIFS